MSRSFPFVSSLEEAREIWSKAISNKPAEETMLIENSLNRVTSKEVKARVSNPFCVLAALDGIAVKSVLTYGAKESLPIKLIIGKEAFRIDTGEPLPLGTDAVIAVENLLYYKEDEVEIGKAVSIGEGVRQPGEDVVEGDTLIPSHTLITPQIVGLLAQGGVKEVTVFSKPKIGILPTGDEVVSHTGEKFIAGEVIDSNSPMLQALVSTWGGIPVKFPVVPNREEALRKAIKEALSIIDVLLVIAGSSKGSKDLVPDVLRSLGDVLVKGVAIRPARPTALAFVDGKPVINIPGYPVSAYLTAQLFLKPLIYRLQGLKEPLMPKIRAKLYSKLPKEVGVKEYLRVYLGRVNDEYIAYPLARGASIISSLAQADGWVGIPVGVEGLEEGENVEVELLKPFEEIDGNLISVGSHDLTLEILSDLIKEKDAALNFKSIPVGSFGGLQGFKKGNIAVCGLHLLEEETGEYNIPFLKNMKNKAILVNLVFREQGIIVKKGNPFNIREIKDLLKPGIRFVNRQRGAGTRILLDYLLKKESIQPISVQGYSDEEFTHFGVALRIKEGLAEVGLGIKAVASIYGLDFIPLYEERYDLLIPYNLLSDYRIKVLLEIMRSKVFKKRVEAFGGYRTELSGKIIWDNS